MSNLQDRDLDNTPVKGSPEGRRFHRTQAYTASYHDDAWLAQGGWGEPHGAELPHLLHAVRGRAQGPEAEA